MSRNKTNNLIDILDRADKRVSRSIHNCYVGMGEIIIAPFALIFNYVYGILVVAVFLATHVCKENSALDPS